MTKRKIFIGIIILVAIILAVSSGTEKNKNKEVLPTRDIQGYEEYENTEEFCKELATSYEFETKDREDSFYASCLVENKQ